MNNKRIEKIVWLDAADNEIDMKDLEKVSTRKYLVKRETYGVVIKEDEYGIIILQDADENGGGEITAIPRGWYERKKRPSKKRTRRNKK